VAAAVPVIPGTLADESQVRFVNEGGGLESLPRHLAGQVAGRQLAELVVDEREQLGGGRGVTGRGGVE
jgi:hypothetical protein